MDEENRNPSSIKWRMYFFFCKKLRNSAKDSSTLPEIQKEKKYCLKWF